MPLRDLSDAFYRFPPEIVAVDVSGRCFDRMSFQRRSLLHSGEYKTGGGTTATATHGSMRRRTRTRRPRSKRRNTLAGTDQKEIRDALTAGFVLLFQIFCSVSTSSVVFTEVAVVKSSFSLRGVTFSVNFSLYQKFKFRL